jgi:hypothetical protein
MFKFTLLSLMQKLILIGQTVPVRPMRNLTHCIIHRETQIFQMSRTCFNILGFFTLVAMIASCSMISGLGHKQFSYYKNDKQKRLVFRLPKGSVEEKFRVGENDAKEQFYSYKDGAMLYVARHITWQTANKQRIDELRPNNQKTTTMFSGTDKAGLLWKEVHFEDFMIGYSNVPPGRAERFNEALNSVKIK